MHHRRRPRPDHTFTIVIVVMILLAIGLGAVALALLLPGGPAGQETKKQQQSAATAVDLAEFLDAWQKNPLTVQKKHGGGGRTLRLTGFVGSFGGTADRPHVTLYPAADSPVFAPCLFVHFPGRRLADRLAAFPRGSEMTVEVTLEGSVGTVPSAEAVAIIGGGGGGRR